MRLRNYEVEALAKFLFDLKLSGRKSRMRTRMVRMLDEYWMKVIGLDRKNLIEEYAMKDEDGEILLNETQTEAILEPSKIQEFETEFQALLNEEYVIEETETNRDMLLDVADTILNCDVELNGNDAVVYDNWCEKFEEMIERYGHKED